MPPVAAAAAAVGAFLATPVVWGLTVGNLLTAAYIVGSAVEQRRAAKRAAARARAAYYGSLQDRSVMVRTAIAPRNLVYGQDKVSGPVVDMFTTGDKKQYLHVIVALAGRPVDGIPTVYFNEWAITEDQIDGDGFVTAAQWCGTTEGSDSQVSVVVDGAGLLTLPRTANSIVAINAYDPGTQTYNDLGGWAHSPGTALVTGLPPGQAVTVTYSWADKHPRVRIHKFLGDHGSVPSALLTETGGRRGAAHVGHGIAWLWVRLEWDEAVFGQIGVPNISALVRGHRVWDPRTSTTVWTDNAALCAADFARDQALGLGCTAAEVPDAELIAEANLCDELVPIHDAGLVNLTNGSTTVVKVSNLVRWAGNVRAGMYFSGPDGVQHLITSVFYPAPGWLILATPYTGPTATGAAYTISQRRYTANGTLSAADGRLASFDAVLEAMAGHAVWTQGRWRLRCGAHPTPEPITITVDHLADTPPRWQRSASRRDLVNAVTATYREPASNFSEVQAPPVTNPLYEAQDGGRRITRQLQLDMVSDSKRAQRLARITLERARQAETLEIECNLRAYDLQPGQVVPVTIARYGWASKLFEVRSRELNISAGTIRYVLRGTAPEVWDWNMGDATTVDPAPDTMLPSPFTRPPMPTGLTLTTGTPTLLALSDGTIAARVLAEWDEVQDAFVTRGGRIEVRWRPQADAAWRSEPALPGDATERLIGPLDEGVPVLVQVRAVNGVGRTSEWAVAAIVVLGKSAPPSDVAAFGGSVAQGILDWSWDACTDIDYAHTEVRSSDADWGSDTVQPLFRGRANRWPEAVTAAGSYSRYARHFDTSGNPSATSATATVAVGPGDLAPGTGSPGLTLSPAAAIVQADALGNVASWAPAQSVATVTAPDGSEDTAGWTYSIDSADGTLATLGGASGNILNVAGFAGASPQFSRTLIQIHANSGFSDSSKFRRAPTQTSSAATFVSDASPVGPGHIQIRYSGITWPEVLKAPIRYGNADATEPGWDISLADFSGKPWTLACFVRVPGRGNGAAGSTSGTAIYDAIGNHYRQIKLHCVASPSQSVYVSGVWRHKTTSSIYGGVTSSVVSAEIPGAIAGGWVHVVLSYCEDGALRLWTNGQLRASQSLGQNRVDGNFGNSGLGEPYSGGFFVGNRSSYEGPDIDLDEIIHVAGIGGPTSGSYPVPTSAAADEAIPAGAVVVIKAQKAGQPDLSASFQISVISQPAEAIEIVPSPPSVILYAEWNGSILNGTQYIDFKYRAAGKETGVVSDCYISPNANVAAQLTHTANRLGVADTASNAPLGGSVRVFASAPGYLPALTRVSFSKNIGAQPTVVAGGPASMSVLADWSDTVASNLPQSATISAMNGGTNEAGLYTWAPSASAGITATTTAGGPTVTLQGMASGTLSGTITMTGARSGWPNLSWTITVTKTLQAQPTVVPGGPTSITVAGATDGTVPAASLPVSVAVTALQAGTDVATSYTWTPSASSGITASNTAGAPTVQITAMDTGTDTGTVTMTGTRSGWPNLVHTITVQKTRLLPVVGSVAQWGPVLCYAFGVTTATARVIIAEDGRVLTRINGLPSEVYSTQWHGPTTTGIGATRWAKVTKLSGEDPSSPSLGTVLSLTSGLTITLSRSTVGALDGNYLVEIYSDSGGTTKVGEGTVYMAAEIS